VGEKVRSNLVMGIDGGGTKTVALLADDSGDILMEEVGGPTNYQVIGIDAASKNLIHLIRTCCKNAGYTANTVAIVVMGLAGAGRVSDQVRISERVIKLARTRRMKLNKIVVESDARIALEGALRGAPGIVMIGGTGSIAFGKDIDGTIHRVGGWGRIVGDEGGGYYLGREALLAVLRQYDGRGEPTILTDLFAERHTLTTVEQIIAAVYSDGFDIASLAPDVVEAARQGDRIAEKILQRGAAEIEEHIRVMSSKLMSAQKIHTALLGGLLSGDNLYAKMIRDKISGSLPNVQIQPAISSPGYGAIIMALSILRTP
jgi:N-acetylglucosamine kinase-like BadF-type ATPase